MDGHLGDFHILAVVNDVAVNVGVPSSLQDLTFSSFLFIPRSRILYYIGLLCGTLEDPPYFSPTAATSSYIPTVSV